jgi:hypothetical protein
VKRPSNEVLAARLAHNEAVEIVKLAVEMREAQNRYFRVWERLLQLPKETRKTSRRDPFSEHKRSRKETFVLAENGSPTPRKEPADSPKTVPMDPPTTPQLSPELDSDQGKLL